MAEIKYRECMWAEMKPDVYGGKNCDQLVPGWNCFCDGDMDAEDNVKKLDLAAKTFAPGTKVVVMEPCCPKCGEPRWPNSVDPKVTFPSKCECGFDWDKWVLNQYS